MNKMDLVQYKKEKFEEIKTSLLEFFKNLGLPPSYIIPISAKKDQNITSRSDKIRWYKGPVFFKP
ncbi:MAG: hypothetical protein ABIH27_00135 [Candidatus Omnitrophota bacterium]